MHELGIVAEVVRVVEDIAKKQNVTRVETLVLQIGELSSVVPYFVEQCYPAAAYGTLLENTRIVIEVLPGNGRCRVCGRVYNIKEDHKKCPACGDGNPEVLGGREFVIKEILAG